MSDPLVDPADLAVYLNDEDDIDETRAEMMITDAQTLCETIVSPLPDAAAVIVKRVAARAYVATTASRGYQLTDSPVYQPSPAGGVYLTQSDVIDLRRLNGASGGAFSVDLLGADYVPPVSWGPTDLTGWYT